MNILLVSPATPRTFWSFSDALPLISKRAAFPPLGLLTVAAMLPRDWKLKLVDLNVTRLSDAQIDWADYVFISGMIVHEASARRVVARCAARGRTVVAGGPLFTTGYERFPEVRHFVLGEAEEIIGDLVADLAAGTPKRLYAATGKPDVTKTPIPRWDLLNMRQYATMPVQFSRGCPFDCEFCDIIVMYGRKPRVKTPEQVVAELDSLVEAGWNGPVFIVDDNFIGNRVKAKALLRALAPWKQRRRDRITFTTEASINLVDDDELLELMVRAGFKQVFIGIESPQEESLAECGKVQNTRRDLVSAVRKIHASGIEVMAGFIVGFDNDTETIFERQRRFIEESGVVTAMVGMLTALPGTKLFSRLTQEGRMLSHSTGNNLDAELNFVPKLDRGVLTEGYRRLVKHLYSPRVYYDRVLTFLRDYRPSGPRIHLQLDDVAAFLRSLWVMGVAERGRREFWRLLLRAFVHHRAALTEAVGLAIIGRHFRRLAASM